MFFNGAMQLKVLLFAHLRELVGQDYVQVPLREPMTLLDVWNHLRGQYPLIDGYGKSVIFSLNQEFAELETPVRDGDEIAIFPPVSGGQHEALSDPYPETEKQDVIAIVHERIRLEDLVKQLSRSEDGAVVTFEGIVRDNTQGRNTKHLEYEAYEPMAMKKMLSISETIHEKWPVSHVGIVHRLGRLEIGEASVIIVVTSPHRQAGFEACRYAIDTLKKTVPIWKKEFFEDGEIWVEGE